MNYSLFSLSMLNFQLLCDFYVDTIHAHTQRNPAHLPKASSNVFSSVGPCSIFLLSLSLSPFLPGTVRTSHVTTHLFLSGLPKSVFLKDGDCHLQFLSDTLQVLKNALNKLIIRERITESNLSRITD